MTEVCQVNRTISRGAPRIFGRASSGQHEESYAAGLQKGLALASVRVGTARNTSVLGLEDLLDKDLVPIIPQDGTHGKDGRDGVAGNDGAAGNDGKDGKDGRDGIDGAAGNDGKDGKDGRDGIDGALGPPGPAGADGPTGPQGPPGDPSLIVYPSNFAGGLLIASADAGLQPSSSLKEVNDQIIIAGPDKSEKLTVVNDKNEVVFNINSKIGFVETATLLPTNGTHDIGKFDRPYSSSYTNAPMVVFSTNSQDLQELERTPSISALMDLAMSVYWDARGYRIAPRPTSLAAVLADHELSKFNLATLQTEGETTTCAINLEQLLWLVVDSVQDQQVMISEQNRRILTLETLVKKMMISVFPNVVKTESSTPVPQVDST